MKNYAGQTFWLTLLVAILLTGLSFLPEGLQIMEQPLRPMDIFSDIRASRPVPLPAAPDALPEMAAPEDTLLVAADTTGSDGMPPLVDSTLFGKILEDYTPAQRGLAVFFAAVDSIRTHQQKVRVAFFGDSFVEGDILLGDLRDTLQSLWGGNGVGFVPITSEVARFKRTLIHEYEGWNMFSIVKKSPDHPEFGINGFAYVPLEGAKVRYEGATYFRHTRSWSNMRLFYAGDSLGPVFYAINGAGAALRQPEPVNGLLGVFDLKYPGMRSVQLEFPQPGGLVLYGAVLEDGPGFYLDNFSIRGNSGGKLKLISRQMMQAFDRHQHYDLVVIQLGLNAVTTTMNNIEWYRWELDGTFAHLKNCFPNCPILVIGVPDRAGKVDNELRTLPAVPAIVQMQRDLARKHGFLFYDLFMGMGGPGTMVRFASEKPALANKDYTHLTHEGGRVMSRLFTKILLEEQKTVRSLPAPSRLSGL